MSWIVSLCVRNAGIVALFAALGLILGVWAVSQAPLDVFPEFVPVKVDIQTEAPGLSPEQVEQLVTRPIEAALNGAPDLAAMRSESDPGLSVVSLDFVDGADPYHARQAIAERVAGIVASLPAGVGAPALSPLVSSTMDLLKIGLVSDKVDPYELRDRAQWILRPQLLGVPGVARVTVFGGGVRQIQIQPDMDRLALYQLTLTDLSDAARAALSLRGGGYIDLEAQRVLLETPSPVPDPAPIAKAVIGVRQGVPIRIGDVAKVELAPTLKTGDALIQGRPGVLIALSSQFGVNTLDATHAVEQVLAAAMPKLKADGIEVYPGLHRPANFIERALSGIAHSLAIAALLIVVVLLAFLRNWRSALISFLAIPLSLVVGADLLARMGMTLNTMTLGGFAVALGVLVDDAIIDIENILRRLRAAGPTAPRLEIIRGATIEIRGPVLNATLVVLIAFTPVLLTSGVQGRFVRPLAAAFMLSVLASLAVALTVTPSLAALLLSAKAAHEEARWITALKRVQSAIIRFADRRLLPIVLLLTLMFFAVLAALPFMSSRFMPDFREGHFVIQVESAVPGTSLNEMLDVGTRISRDLLAVPAIATVEQQVGRSEGGEDTFGTGRSEFHVELKPEATADQAGVQAQIRKILSGYPGLNVEVVTFLGDRLSESLTGESGMEVVNIFGDDLDALDDAATKISAILGTIPGVTDLQTQHAGQTPALSIVLRPDALAAYGLKAQQVLDTVQAAYAGAVIGQTYSGTRKLDVVLTLPKPMRSRIEQVGALKLGSPFGPIALRDVADVAPTEGRYNILHEQGQRRVIVGFNVKDADLQSVVARAKEQIARALPQKSDLYWRFAGQAEAGQSGTIELALYSVLAIAVVMAVLILSFRRRAHPWLVLVNLPFSLIGSILAIAVTGIGLSLGSLVGLATVFGIGARNSILLLAHYEHLVEKEGAVWSEDTVLRGAAERLVPILMTATVTALGLAPLAVGLGTPGQEIQGPMAVSVLGGLVSSTLLNLLLLPAIAARFSYPGGSFRRISQTTPKRS